MTVLCPLLTFKSWANNGTPNAFGTVATYTAGTQVPIATYTDATGSVSNGNPIALNARGEANIWIVPNTAYKFVEYDSSGTLLKTTDQVINAQLLTLYGGTDGGTVNTYVLNFAAPFSSYIDGTIIYFTPSTTNTGASTININGLGAIPVILSTGLALTANQINSAQVAEVMILGGNAVLLNPSALYPTIGGGTSTLTLAGFSGTAPTVGVTYSTLTGSTFGTQVFLNIPNVSGTSNSTSFSATLPSGVLVPSTALATQFVDVAVMKDNGTAIYSQVARIDRTGTLPSVFTAITFYKNGVTTGWTNTGVKGITDGTTSSSLNLSFRTQ